jgi:DNA-binding beta-propeller fold protein YncE
VSVIDADTEQVVDTWFPSGSSCASVAINPLTQRLYVSCRASNSIVGIDAGTGQGFGVAQVGSWPTGVAVNPRTNRVLSANQLSASVTFVSGSTMEVLGTVTKGIGLSPTYIGIDYRSGHAFVTNQDSATVSVIGPMAA